MLVLFVFSATITDNFVFNKISSCDLAELWNSASRNLSLRDSILVIRSTSTWLGGKLFGKSKMKVQITIKLAIYFLMLRKLQPSNNKLITGLFKSTGFLLTWFAQPVITNPVVHVARVQLLDLDLKLYPSYMPHILNKDLTPFLQSLSGKPKLSKWKKGSTIRMLPCGRHQIYHAIFDQSISILSPYPSSGWIKGLWAVWGLWSLYIKHWSYAIWRKVGNMKNTFM